MENNTVASVASIEAPVEAMEWSAAAEQHLWLAVVAGAIEDWLHAPLRIQREAERYLFHDQIDFPAVCQSAGIDASSLWSRLERLRPQTPQHQETHRFAA